MLKATSITFFKFVIFKIICINYRNDKFVASKEMGLEFECALMFSKTYNGEMVKLLVKAAILVTKNDPRKLEQFIALR